MPNEVNYDYGCYGQLRCALDGRIEHGTGFGVVLESGTIASLQGQGIVGHVEDKGLEFVEVAIFLL